jgi:hypothetical protein
MLDAFGWGSAERFWMIVSPAHSAIKRRTKKIVLFIEIGVRIKL